MTREDKEFLKQSHLFKGLYDGDIGELEQVSRMDSCERKKSIYRPEDPSDSIYIIRSGRVKITRVTEDGKEIILGLLKNGDIFGEMAILENGPRGTFAEALDSTIYYQINVEDLYRIMRRKPTVIIRLARIIGRRRLEAENSMENLLHKGVRERLAGQLLKLSKDYGVKDSRGSMLRIKITHQDLANLIGSSRETVSLILGDLRREGVIDIEERKIIIKDEPALERIA